MNAGIWTSEKLLFDGDDYFDAVFEDIENAKESVLVETYIYTDDALGQRVADHLIRASRRGLEVRLIVDGIGASGWYDKNGSRLEREGVKVRVYHPVLFSTLSRLNRRDHRKLFAIDSKIAYVGSLNITADHCESIIGEKAWHDTAVRIEGGPIGTIITSFNAVWVRSHDLRGRRHWRERFSGHQRKLKPSRLVRLNQSMRLRRRSYKELIHKISEAKERVWITNAYFAPSAKLVRALKKAGANGADVRVLVPRNSDVFFMPWVATSYYPLVLKAKGRIYEYLPRFLHAKTAIVDGWTTIGSSNMNRRSLMHDLELDLVLTAADVKRSLSDQFLKDLEHSEEVLSAQSGFRGAIEAFFGRLISRVLKNLI